MTDPLGEALAYPVVAVNKRMDEALRIRTEAARNWHTLTTGTEAYQAVGTWYLANYGIDFPASDAHAMLDAVVDALTVTPTLEENPPQDFVND